MEEIWEREQKEERKVIGRKMSRVYSTFSTEFFFCKTIIMLIFVSHGLCTSIYILYHTAQFVAFSTKVKEGLGKVVMWSDIYICMQQIRADSRYGWSMLTTCRPIPLVDTTSAHLFCGTLCESWHAVWYREDPVTSSEEVE